MWKNRKIIILSLLALVISSISLRKQIFEKVHAVSTKINQLHSYDYPSESNGWHKFGVLPVYGNQSTGPIFDPFVWFEDSSFLMCASERKSGSLITLESKDEYKWLKKSVMLKPVKNTWEDIVNRGCVVKTDSTYLLYYTGQKNLDMGGQSSIGVAVSNDGIHYKRILKCPVLVPQNKIEKQSVMNPCVLYDKKNKIFKMWYAAGETYEPDVICYAESKNGFKWIKYQQPVLTSYKANEWEQFKVGGCQVLTTPYGYEMYYIGYQNIDVARVCYATSNNGINWNRTSNNLLLSPTRNRWDADATYKPTVIKKDKTFFLYYNGRKGSEEYIGLAVKKAK